MEGGTKETRNEKGVGGEADSQRVRGNCRRRGE